MKTIKSISKQNGDYLQRAKELKYKALIASLTKEKEEIVGFVANLETEISKQRELIESQMEDIRFMAGQISAYEKMLEISK